MVRYINPNVEGIHPLRRQYGGELPTEMSKRIVDALDTGEADDITTEELEAFEDLMYDRIVGMKQTHEGVTIVQ